MTASMTTNQPSFSTPHVTVYQGDALEVLRSLPDGSVDCCVTSPPYWGLRDYGVAGQLGLENTPEGYVAALVGILREVRRVLRGAGTLWLNLGDSYAGSGKGRMGDGTHAMNGGDKQHSNKGSTLGILPDIDSGLKPKDMVGIPWMVAFALRADGWYLRSDIIWSKPNPMPESVTDRPTKAHEYVFLLSKSERYFFDQDAVREPAVTNEWPGIGPQHGTVRQRGEEYVPMRVNALKADETPRNDGGRWNENAGRGFVPIQPGRNIRSVWEIATQPYPEAHFATFPREIPERCIKAGCPADGTVIDPFAGSGTTLAVARDLGRKSIGIELNPAYVTLIEKRCSQLALDMSA